MSQSRISILRWSQNKNFDCDTGNLANNILFIEYIFFKLYLYKTRYISSQSEETFPPSFILFDRSLLPLLSLLSHFIELRNSIARVIQSAEYYYEAVQTAELCDRYTTSRCRKTNSRKAI